MTSDACFDVSAILLQNYNLSTLSFRRLSGYEELNYHVKCLSNTQETDMSINEFVLKIVNEKDSSREGLIEAVADVLEQAANDDRVTVPRPVKNIVGSYVGYFDTADSWRRKILLLEYIPGRTVCMDEFDLDMFHKFCFQVSVTAGKLENVLTNIHPPPALNRSYLHWDLQNLHQAKDKLGVVKNLKTKNVCWKVMEHLRILCENEDGSNVRKGIIHMDFNITNFVIGDDSSVVGVIDFFDCCFSFCVFDVSIMIAHMLERGSRYPKFDPYKMVNVALSGFQKEYSLNREELKFLYYGVMGRFVTLLVLLQIECVSCKDTADHVREFDFENVENCLLEMWRLGEMQWLDRIAQYKSIELV